MAYSKASQNTLGYSLQPTGQSKSKPLVSRLAARHRKCQPKVLCVAAVMFVALRPKSEGFGCWERHRIAVQRLHGVELFRLEENLSPAFLQSKLLVSKEKLLCLWLFSCAVL